MIDRDARNCLYNAIDDYMDDKMETVEFIDLLNRVIATTEDPLPKQIYQWISQFHDNEIPSTHLIFSRFSWQMFNRFRLLLASDTEIEEIGEPYRWGFRQILPLVLVLVFVVGLIAVHRSPDAYLLSWGMFMILTLATWCLFFWRSWTAKQPKIQLRRDVEFIDFDDNIQVFPFESFGEILCLRRTIPGFKCKKYRKEVQERVPKESFLSRLGNLEIRFFPKSWDNVFAKFALVATSVFWIPILFFFGSPLILIYMLFPEGDRFTVLKLPEFRT